MAGGCGLGALLATKQQKVWGIGVDADQSFLGPHILTSALKGVDSAVFLTSKAVQDGTFKGGGNAVFGLDQEGVGLGTFSPNANKADIAKVEEIEKQIADGTITGIPTTLGSGAWRCPRARGHPAGRCGLGRNTRGPALRCATRVPAGQPVRRHRDDAPRRRIAALDRCLDRRDRRRRALQLATHGAKVRHIRADPRVSVVVIDPAEMYRWVGVTGTAELVEEGADDHIDRLAKKYLGTDTYPFRTARRSSG